MRTNSCWILGLFLVTVFMGTACSQSLPTTRNMPLPLLYGSDTRHRGVAIDHNELFLVQSCDGPTCGPQEPVLVAVMTLEDGRLVRQLALNHTPDGLAFLNGFLWTIEANGRLHKLRPMDGEEVLSVPAAVPGPYWGFTADAFSLWLGTLASPSGGAVSTATPGSMLAVAQLDPATGSSVTPPVPLSTMNPLFGLAFGKEENRHTLLTGEVTNGMLLIATWNSFTGEPIGTLPLPGQEVSGEGGLIGTIVLPPGSGAIDIEVIYIPPDSGVGVRIEIRRRDEDEPCKKAIECVRDILVELGQDPTFRQTLVQEVKQLILAELSASFMSPGNSALSNIRLFTKEPPQNVRLDTNVQTVHITSSDTNTLIDQEVVSKCGVGVRGAFTKIDPELTLCARAEPGAPIQVNPMCGGLGENDVNFSLQPIEPGMTTVTGSLERLKFDVEFSAALSLAEGCAVFNFMTTSSDMPLSQPVAGVNVEVISCGNGQVEPEFDEACDDGLAGNSNTIPDACRLVPLQD